MTVPNGWVIRPISQLTKSINSGISRPFTESDVGVPVLRSNNVRWGQINLDQVKYWYNPDPRGADLKLVTPVQGDVLVNFVNGSRSELGKAALYQGELSPCIVSTNLFIVRFNTGYITPEFANAFFQSFEYRRALSRVVGFSGPGSFNKQQLGDIEIRVPPIEEQRKIAEILGTWDEAIRLTAELIAAKQQRKKGLMQRLLTGEVRFPGFAHSGSKQSAKYFQIPSDWSLVKIGDIAHQVTRKNIDDHQLPVLSCTKHDGLVDSLEYFGRQIFSDDISTYKVVRRGQFAYATNHIEEGSIGYQDKYDEAVISPMYTVFEASKQVDDRYLYRVLKTETYRKIFEINTNASVNRRGSLRWNEFSTIQVPLPSLKEQEKVSDFFEACDHEIDLLQQKLAALQQQKKGLMQRLLTGEVRVKV